MITKNKFYIVKKETKEVVFSSNRQWIIEAIYEFYDNIKYTIQWGIK